MLIYNTLTRKKEKFIPLNRNRVLIYVCGITPYDTTHIGHAFTYVFFDALIRFFKYKKYKVIYTQNVTDIDEDILKKAHEAKMDWQKLGNFWTKRFLTDLRKLNVLKPAYYIKATNSIGQMHLIIKDLLQKNIAYQKNGNIYFAVDKFKNYGNFSRFNFQQMLLIAKERGGHPEDPLRDNPLDFLLWQNTKKTPYWESPWGKGRPGWHIECSAMIKEYLGEQIDIHGGGHDLIFPHHESEIAQSESFTGKKPFVKYWLHTSMVLYEGEKMSKSLGNLVMVSDLLKIYSASALRWTLLNHHYRTPWEFSKEEVDKAEKIIAQIKRLKTEAIAFNKTAPKETFIKALEDDLDTPLALAVIQSQLTKVVREKNQTKALESTSQIFKELDILGFN